MTVPRKYIPTTEIWHKSNPVTDIPEYKALMKKLKDLDEGRCTCCGMYKGGVYDPLV